MKTSLNFAQKTNFIAGCPQIKGLEFYLQDVTLPGINLDLAETETYALKSYLAPSSHSYNSLSFNILIDEDFEIYHSFFNNIVDAKSLVNGTYAQIEFDFYVQIYNNKGRLLFTEFFKNCMLEGIGDVSLSSTDSGVTNTFSADFKFDWLEIVRDGLPEEKRKEWNIYPKLKPLSEEDCCCDCACCGGKCCNESAENTSNVNNP